MNLLKAHYVGIRQLQKRLSILLNKKTPLIITKRGKPKKIILPYEDMLEFLDLISEMNDQQTRRIIERGRRAIQKNPQGIRVLSKSF